MRIEGTLATFPLRELVEMVMYSSVTGVLEIHGNAGPGRLFFRDGRPYHAVCGQASGLEAMRELFLDCEAHFLFIADIIADTETLWMDPLEALDYCESRAKRLLQTRAVIPDLSLIPSIIPSATSQVSIDSDDWPLLSVIDGQRSVATIATDLSCDIVEVCESIQRMVERRQVRLSVHAAPASQAHLGSNNTHDEESSAQGRGLLERLLDTLPNLTTDPGPQPVSLPKPSAARMSEEDPIVKLLRS